LYVYEMPALSFAMIWPGSRHDAMLLSSMALTNCETMSPVMAERLRVTRRELNKGCRHLAGANQVLRNTSFLEIICVRVHPSGRLAFVGIRE